MLASSHIYLAVKLEHFGTVKSRLSSFVCLLRDIPPSRCNISTPDLQHNDGCSQGQKLLVGCLCGKAVTSAHELPCFHFCHHFVFDHYMPANNSSAHQHHRRRSLRVCKVVHH